MGAAAASQTRISIGAMPPAGVSLKFSALVSPTMTRAVSLGSLGTAQR